MPFTSIALVGFAPRSPMAQALSRALSRRVLVEADPRRAQVQLHALVDARERSVVATTAAAQVREQQLRVRLRWRVLAADGRELSAPAELALARDMSYSEAAALAKAYEAESLYLDMQNDIVDQVMRRLSRLAP